MIACIMDLPSYQRLLTGKPTPPQDGPQRELEGDWKGDAYSCLGSTFEGRRRYERAIKGKYVQV